MMLTRRHAVRLVGSASAAALCAVTHSGFFAGSSSAHAGSEREDLTPSLAPGAPTSPERTALIDAFKKQSDGLEKKFEARTYPSDHGMPYRLFRPGRPAGKRPLVVYLHGSGGLGDDNLKQLGLGNIFGTRVWLLPENQKRFPCYVVAPQTDQGWVRYDFSKETADRPPEVLPGLGDGARRALELIDALRRELPIDDRRIYVTGQSMGGAGTWHLIAHRPKFFAAAAICCGSISTEDGTGSIDTPLWNFHGDSDPTVPVSTSRDRIAARRKAGGHPLYTEYAAVGHNCWQWTYTEPALPNWLFSQSRC
jgi:predicted peptidase